jgi:hypothetical protein
VLEKGPNDPGMHPDMFTAFKVSFVTILVLFTLLFILRVRLEFLKSEAQNLRIRD